MGVCRLLGSTGRRSNGLGAANPTLRVDRTTVNKRSHHCSPVHVGKHAAGEAKPALSRGIIGECWGLWARGAKQCLAGWPLLDICPGMRHPGRVFRCESRPPVPVGPPGGDKVWGPHSHPNVPTPAYTFRRAGSLQC